MFDFNKPKIEITEISEDKKFGRFVVEPLEEVTVLHLAILLENYAVLPAGSCSKSG